MLRAMAAGIGVAYESISRDYSQTNYSSSRLSLLEERENWKALQQMLISNLHRRVYEAWMDAAVAVGEIDLPDYSTNRRRYQAARWMPRGWAWVDPSRETEAYEKAVRAGFKTQAEVVAEQGGDLEELLMARKAELDRSAELGIKFTTDPADDMQGGAPGMAAGAQKQGTATVEPSTASDSGSQPGTQREAAPSI
jgi:lambda family phage portal protein